MSLVASSKILIYQLALPQVYYPTSQVSLTPNLNIQKPSLEFKMNSSGPRGYINVGRRCWWHVCDVDDRHQHNVVHIVHTVHNTPRPSQWG